MKYFNILIFLYIIFLISCGNNKDLNNVKADSLLLKTIKYPPSLFYLKSDSVLVDFKSDSIQKYKFKFIATIDANCSKCILGKLNKIDSVFENYLFKNNEHCISIYILNVKTEDLDYFLYSYAPMIKAKGLILIDLNYDFEIKNNLISNEHETKYFLVDHKDNIIVYGNPLNDSKIFKLYNNKISTQ
ncbi:MAG: hypothetical protein ACOCWM_02820 [Cyclobacteriaceae bacterium]